MNIMQINRILSPDYEVLYQIENKEVYVLEDSSNIRWVAKVIEQEIFDETKFDLWLKIKHNFIAKIVKRINTDDSVIFIIEYIKGQTLYDYVLENGPLSEAEVKPIMEKLINIFDYLHNIESGLIYRDIHPKNIIINDGEVYLIDLDSSRIYKNTASFDTVAIGVIGFIAPEQYGFEQSSVQSDIYSLGVLIAYLMTGTIPCFNNNRIQLNNLELSKPFRKLIYEMTAISRDGRPSTMKRVLRKLYPERKNHFKWIAVVCVIVLLGGSGINMYGTTFSQVMKDKAVVENIEGEGNILLKIGTSKNNREDNRASGSQQGNRQTYNELTSDQLDTTVDNLGVVNGGMRMLSKEGFFIIEDFAYEKELESINPVESFAFMNTSFVLHELKKYSDETHTYIYVSYDSPIWSHVLGIRLAGDAPGLNMFTFTQNSIVKGRNNIIYKIENEILEGVTYEICLELGDENSLSISLD